MSRARPVAVGDRSTDEQGTAYVPVVGHHGTELLFQQVADARSGKNRLHLDLAAVDGTRDEEIGRLTGLGAEVVDPAPDHPWVVLADPEGNAFCVVDEAEVSSP